MVEAESLEHIVFVKYSDHVLYNRASALAMQPQIREAVGWLVYECEQYIIISWDRDAQPPTLHNGDPKASGLVLLKPDILELKQLPLKEISGWWLNSAKPTVRAEHAFRPTERKTHSHSKGDNKQ